MTPIARSVVTHAVILGLATSGAAYVWLRDKAPAANIRRDVVVWRGRGADIDRLELSKKGRHVVLEGKSDKTGRYWIGTAESDGTSAPAEAAGHDPHDPHAPPATPTTAPGARSSAMFVTVAGGQKIADKLGELRAARDLGKVADDKAAELGLKEPEARVKVTIRGTVHNLDLGMLAPGGSDRYVRDADTLSVFVVDAEPLRDLEAGERTLVEKDLHEFPLDPDVDKVTIAQGSKRRTILRRGTAARRFFADPGSPDTNDETATTWMAKVDRLKPSEFINTEPPSAPSDRLRLEFAGNKGTLGFVEIARGLSTQNGEADVFLRSERTRLWAKVPRSLGEQVLGDAASIVR
jgi:hypothetical protein